MKPQPSVFIGSSSEAKPLADAIDISLRPDCRCKVWDTGLFKLGENTLAALMKSLPKFDFAILVFSPDDLAEVRNQKVSLPRDNVLFELGLFMGHSGPDRALVLYWDDGNTKVPTDLAGVTLARVKPRSKEKRIRDYSLKELVDEIKPALAEIRDAIRKVSLPVTVHYIAPTSSHSEYYGLLQLRLQLELESGEMSWRFHPCSGKIPQEIYQQLRKILKTTTSSDVILLIPKGLTDASLLADLEGDISRHPETRIVFLDQQPPKDLLEYENVSSVGPDNRKVGILAAYALHKRLKNEPGVSYWSLRGPGGPARSEGFIEAMKFFGAEDAARAWPISDSDRFANRDSIKIFLEQARNDEAVGVFAGNDENAFAVLRAAEELDRANVFVVGCDGSREIRFHMDRPGSPLVATIKTELAVQAAKVLALLQQTDQRNVRLDPELHHFDPDFEKQLQDPQFRSFWEGE